MKESSNKMYLSMEKMGGGSLHDQLKRARETGRKLSDHDMSQILGGILSAVAYLHERDIAHRDLKPGTVPGEKIIWE